MAMWRGKLFALLSAAIKNAPAAYLVLPLQPPKAPAASDFH
jgi:hypothetical protein